MAIKWHESMRFQWSWKVPNAVLDTYWNFPFAFAQDKFISRHGLGMFEKYSVSNPTRCRGNAKQTKPQPFQARGGGWVHGKFGMQQAQTEMKQNRPKIFATAAKPQGVCCSLHLSHHPCRGRHRGSPVAQPSEAELIDVPLKRPRDQTPNIFIESWNLLNYN